MIKLILKHKDREKAQLAAQKLANLLCEQLGSYRILGPEEPIINRIRNEHLMDILIKLERTGINLGKAKDVIRNMVLELLKDKELKTTKVIVDVDPY